MKSGSVSVNVAATLTYALSIFVAPTSGKVGGTFKFWGYLVQNVDSAQQQAAPGKTVSLQLEGVGAVGNATTNAQGGYEIYWVANYYGNLVFWTQATV